MTTQRPIIAASELAATGVTISPLLVAIVAGVLILGVLLLLISRLRSRRGQSED